MRIGIAIVMLWLCGLGTRVNAQGFNIDLESEHSSIETGRGAPSPFYSAASSQIGVWHALPTSWITQNLIDISGNLSSVTIQGTNGGSGGGTNFPQNTGDYRRLMSDARSISSPFTIQLSGIALGQYSLFTYAASIALPSSYVVTEVFIPQAIVPSQIVTGPMPSSGNVFQQGITHTYHSVNITNGNLEIHIDRLYGTAWLNGFQLIPVPEPACIFSLSSFLVFLQINRRRNRQRAE